jgi:hypothetical protein
MISKDALINDSIQWDREIDQNRFVINSELIKTLLVIADVVEVRDPYTGGRLRRVSQLPNRSAFPRKIQ